MTSLKAHLAQPLVLVASLILLLGISSSSSYAQSRSSSQRVTPESQPPITMTPMPVYDAETRPVDVDTDPVEPTNGEPSSSRYSAPQRGSWYEPAGPESGRVLNDTTAPREAMYQSSAASSAPQIPEAMPLEFSDLEEIVASMSFKIVLIGFGLVLLLTVISLSLKNIGSILKMLLFWSITATITLVTVYLAGSTVYVNFNSSSGGPVHWHADMEVWACGTEVDLVNPTGLSNKIGTATLHEHNDKRIHLEGVVVKPHDASLGKYFHVIGGEITPGSLTFPSTDGVKRLVSGESCSDGTLAQLQVFVYKVEGAQYIQQKVSNPEAYIISPESAVPPGDCIIVEYGPAKDRTDKLCKQYEVANQIGKLQGEKR